MPEKNNHPAHDNDWTSLWLTRVLPVVVLAAAMVGFFALDGSQWLNLSTLAEQRETLRAWVKQYAVLSVIAFVSVYMLAVAASLPGATIFSVSAGVLFGQWLGTAVVVIGATSGAVILFWVVQSALGQGLRQRAGPWFDKIAQGFQSGAVSYLLFMRLVPLFPFFVVNIVSAMLGVRGWVFAWTTAVGILPGAVVYVSAGVGLDSVIAQGTILTPQTAVAFAALGIISLVPVAYRWWKKFSA